MSSSRADDAAFHVRECNALLAQLRQAVRSAANTDRYFLMQNILLSSRSRGTYFVLEEQSTRALELISHLSEHISALGRAATTLRPKTRVAGETWLQVFEFLDAETLPAIQLCSRTFRDLVARQRTTLALFKVDVAETWCDDGMVALCVKASNGWTWCADGWRKDILVAVSDLLTHSHIEKLDLQFPRMIQEAHRSAIFVDVHVKRLAISDFPPKSLYWFVFEALSSVQEVENWDWDDDDDGCGLVDEFRQKCNARGIIVIGRNTSGFDP